jgi:hypothetical protein
VTIRNSYFLANRGNGLSLAGLCNADLGNATASGAGNNVFNTSTQANTLAGICDSNSTGLTVTVSSSDFKCTASPASGCAFAGSPPNTPSTGFACFGVDMGGAGLSNLKTLGPSCCHDVTVP